MSLKALCFDINIISFIYSFFLFLKNVSTYFQIRCDLYDVLLTVVVVLLMEVFFLLSKNLFLMESFTEHCIIFVAPPSNLFEGCEEVEEHIFTITEQLLTDYISTLVFDSSIPSDLRDSLALGVLVANSVDSKGKIEVIFICFFFLRF